MLKKLLKYDFKAVLKIWWIAAAAVLVLSPVAGLCLKVTNSMRSFPAVVEVVAVLGLVLGYIALLVFVLLTVIVLAMRFYKNFFTDEGYLTFTLPVRRGQLLNSKLIVSLATHLMTFFVCGLSILLMLLVGEEDFIAQFREFWIEFWEIPRQEGFLGWAILYVVEFAVILLLGIVFSELFLDCCVTFGCIVAKKAKVAASIGIYYAASNVFSFVLTIFLMFGISSLGSWLSAVNIAETAAYALIALLFFGVIAIMALFCSLLYTLQYWMLDRKLNLP